MIKRCALLSFLFFWHFIYANNSAVILAYHHVGNNKYPSTNVSLKHFKQEMQWLHTHGYHVLSLTDIVNHLKKNELLPDKTIGISFDDAYKSVLTNALPLLKKYNFPFTLFISPKFIPSSSSTKSVYCSWKQINALPTSLVTLGNHTYSHPHMLNLSAHSVHEEIARAEKTIAAKTGIKPKLFAYPYGEYSHAIRLTVKNMEFFTAAFSQTSGSNDAFSNRYSLQRFPINDAYHSEERFSTITKTRALDISRVSPGSIVINRGNPKIKLLNKSIGLSQFNCFPASGGALNLVSGDNGTYSITLKKSFTAGRNKINCTARDRKSHLYWRGLFFFVKKNNARSPSAAQITVKEGGV